MACEVVCVGDDFLSPIRVGHTCECANVRPTVCRALYHHLVYEYILYIHLYNGCLPTGKRVVVVVQPDLLPHIGLDTHCISVSAKVPRDLLNGSYIDMSAHTQRFRLAASAVAIHSSVFVC